MPRESNSPSNYERSYRILEYLRQNSDSKHTVTQAQLLKAPELAGYTGGKETLRDIIINMVTAMNFNEHDVKSKSEWVLNYENFEREFSDAVDSEDSETWDDLLEDDEDWRSLKIQGLYYQHTFTYDEINHLSESVLFSDSLTKEEKTALIEKMEDHLTQCH